MISSSLIQLTWFVASVLAGGAVWYFLSNRDYVATLWTAFFALVLVLAAVAFEIHNTLGQRPPATDSAVASKSNTPNQPLEPQAPSPKSGEMHTLDQQEAAIASADTSYSPMTMEEYFDNWYRKATTSLQREELEASMLNKRVIWNGTIKEVQPGSRDTIRVLVEPTGGGYGSTAFLDFDRSQRTQLIPLHSGQQIRFTGRIKSIVVSPFLSDCRILTILD